MPDRKHGKTGSIILKSDFDREALWGRVDQDRALLRELVAVFAEETPQLLARIEEGIRAGLAGDVRKASHKLKGSLLQFSAGSAAAAAQELEGKAQSGPLAGAAPLLDRLKHEIELLQEDLNAMVRGQAPAQERCNDSRRETISGE